MRTLAPFLCLFLLVSKSTQAKDEDFEHQLAEQHRLSTSFAERIERITRAFVSKPYQRSPLGEGEGGLLDADPRFRLDAFDCTTFVEAAIVLSRCDNLESAKTLLDQLRYSGAPSFENRHHLIESQWIPALEKSGYIRDITESTFEKSDVRWIEFQLDEKRWKNRRIAKELPLGEEIVPKGSYKLPIISIEKLAQNAHKIPAGTIVNVVRADVPWSPVLITHQGIVFVKNGDKRFVRHASPVLKRVIDEPIENMIKRYQKPRKWPIIGLNLLEISEPTISRR